LVSALRDFLGERIRLGSKVQGIDKKGRGYVLFFPDGSSIETDIVVSASPAYAVSEMLRNMDRRLSNLVAEIPYPSLSVVCLGYRKEKIHSPVDAFGFLIPSREKRKILGTLYDSSIFPNRAPEGYVLLRSMVGGARASALARENEAKLVDLVQGELAAIMDIGSAPDFVRVYRHEMAIPQYTVGHLERLRNIDAILQKHKNLYLTGNAYKGIGVNDCIENSFRLAEKMIEES
jgi:oxygen-dependent protoporphyrinogen oxidase